MTKINSWVPSGFHPYHIQGPLFEASNKDKSETWWSAFEAIHLLDWQKADLNFFRNAKIRQNIY